VSELLVRNYESVMELGINRPEKRNAINFHLMDEIADSLELAKNDSSVKLIVIRGIGDQAFCSGGDLFDFHALETETRAYEMLSKMGEVLHVLATFPKPTIAYINGIAIGGGCEIATACDIRIAHVDAKMGFVQGNQAITTGWGGGTLLMEKKNVDQALHILYSAGIMTASEAEKRGFVTEIVKDDKAFHQILQQYSQKEYEVLQAYKRILLRKWNGIEIKDRMLEEIECCSKLWIKEEHLLAMKRFHNRKKHKDRY